MCVQWRCDASHTLVLSPHFHTTLSCSLPFPCNVDTTKLDTSSPEKMYASLRLLVPADALRKGPQLLQLRCLTSTPFLSGVTVGQASASLDDARNFLHDMEPVRGQPILNGAAQTRTCKSRYMLSFYIQQMNDDRDDSA